MSSKDPVWIELDMQASLYESDCPAYWYNFITSITKDVHIDDPGERVNEAFKPYGKIYDYGIMFKSAEDYLMFKLKWI